MAKRARDEADWEEIAELGARLRLARLEAGITQVQMAALLGTSQPLISNYERGVNLIEAFHIARWADETKRDVRDLLGMSDPDNASRLSSSLQMQLLADVTAA